MTKPSPYAAAAREVLKARVMEMCAHYASGLSAAKIAGLYGVTCPTVCYHLRRSGVVLRPRGWDKVTHGHTRGAAGSSRRFSPEWSTWIAMNQRCHYPNHVKYPKYGGRGISVCDRWRNSFSDFLADMGPRPKGKTLDRKDNDQGYSPSNCRWATAKEQRANRRKATTNE